MVIAPGWGGVLVHECFGHSLEGDGIRKKTSIRASQLGQQVAAKGVDIFDDGTVLNGRGSFKVDDEGTPSRKNQVVKDGVLIGYLWDRLNLKYADAALTKGAIADRQRAAHRAIATIPIPRMTNTYIANGTRDPKEIIAEVKDGHLLRRHAGRLGESRRRHVSASPARSRTTSRTASSPPRSRT